MSDDILPKRRLVFNDRGILKKNKRVEKIHTNIRKNNRVKMYTYIRLLFKYIYIYIHTCIYKVRDRDIVTVYDVVCQQKALKSCSSATVWESWLSEMTKQREREDEREGW